MNQQSGHSSQNLISQNGDHQNQNLLITQAAESSSETLQKRKKLCEFCNVREMCSNGDKFCAGCFQLQQKVQKDNSEQMQGPVFFAGYLNNINDQNNTITIKQ